MTVMERFKVADNVLILAQFAHLYPSNTGVVVHIKPDPFRPTFNEYTVQFPDGSTGKLFEFQLLEAEGNYTAQTAVVAFDSEGQAATRELRGQRQDRQIILRTPDFDIDMKIQVNKSRASIVGQLLGRGTTDLSKDAEIRLMKVNTPLATVRSDGDGIFKFDAVPSGWLNILVIAPQHRAQILGAFSV